MAEDNPRRGKMQNISANDRCSGGEWRDGVGEMDESVTATTSEANSDCLLALKPLPEEVLFSQIEIGQDLHSDQLLFR